jgi:hypothetical protein
VSRIKAFVTALMISSAAAACSGNGDLYGGVQPVSGAASLRVSNNSQLAMDMYVRSGGVTQRLGAVSPGLSGSFVLQPEELRDGPVELFAQPIGGGRIIRSGGLAVSPGGIVDFYIGHSYLDSHVSVR